MPQHQPQLEALFFVCMSKHPSKFLGAPRGERHSAQSHIVFILLTLKLVPSKCSSMRLRMFFLSQLVLHYIITHREFEKAPEQSRGREKAGLRSCLTSRHSPDRQAQLRNKNNPKGWGTYQLMVRGSRKDKNYNVWPHIQTTQGISENGKELSDVTFRKSFRFKSHDDISFLNMVIRQTTTHPFPASLGTVQEVAGYFSTSGEECAVVTEEHREHRLAYKFLNYLPAAFSFSLPLKHSTVSPHTLASQEPAQLPWRTWQYSTHLERGGVWKQPRSFGLEMWFFQNPVWQLLCLTGMIMDTVRATVRFVLFRIVNSSTVRVVCVYFMLYMLFLNINSCDTDHPWGLYVV